MVLWIIQITSCIKPPSLGCFHGQLFIRKLLKCLKITIKEVPVSHMSSITCLGL